MEDCDVDRGSPPVGRDDGQVGSVGGWAGGEGGGDGDGPNERQRWEEGKGAEASQRIDKSAPMAPECIPAVVSRRE